MAITTSRCSPSTLRYLAVLAAAAVAVSLLPLSGVAHAQEDEVDDPFDACPVEAPAHPFADRDDIPNVHLANVDCAAFLDIVRGFVDETYRPRLAVRRDQMATFIAQTLDAAGVLLPEGDEDQFTDVTREDDPHRVNINRLAEAGIVLGGPLHLPEDQYGPALRTRRDQMTSFLMRAAGYAFFDDPDAFEEEYADAEQTFPDVPETNVHFGNVEAAADNGIALGFPDDLFRPRQHTTRDQMASFVVRLLNFLTAPVQVEITDQSADWALTGETITVTATVFDQWGNAWGEGVEVDFTAEGFGVEPETDTVTTDEDSEADFTFTSHVHETVTVTAEVEGPGNFAGDADSVEKEFRAFEFIDLDPFAAQNDPLEGEHTVTATFLRFDDDTGDHQPVPGIDLRFEAYRCEVDTADDEDEFGECLEVPGAFQVPFEENGVEVVDWFRQIATAEGETDSDGQAVLTYTSPPLLHDDADWVFDIIFACWVAEDVEVCIVVDEETNRLVGEQGFNDVWSFAFKTWGPAPDFLGVDDDVEVGGAQATRAGASSEAPSGSGWRS